MKDSLCTSLSPKRLFTLYFRVSLWLHDLFHVLENRPYFGIYTTILVLFQTLHGPFKRNALIYQYKFATQPWNPLGNHPFENTEKEDMVITRSKAQGKSNTRPRLPCTYLEKIFLAFFEENLLMMPISNYKPLRSGVRVTLINSFLLGRKEKVFK